VEKTGQLFSFDSKVVSSGPKVGPVYWKTQREEVAEIPAEKTPSVSLSNRESFHIPDTRCSKDGESSTPLVLHPGVLQSKTK